MQWEVGKAVISDVESKFCNYDKTDCYSSKSVPVIFEISEHTGYKTGGQNITVKGYGFDSGTIDAKIDGQKCKVTKFSKYEFSCSVQAKATESDLSKPFIGQYGASRKFVKKSSWLSLSKMETYSGTKKLNMNLESKVNYGDKIGDFYQTWFVPPITKRYRFYMACNRDC